MITIHLKFRDGDTAEAMWDDVAVEGRTQAHALQNIVSRLSRRKVMWGKVWVVSGTSLSGQFARPRAKPDPKPEHDPRQASLL